FEVMFFWYPPPNLMVAQVFLRESTWVSQAALGAPYSPGPMGVVPGATKPGLAACENVTSADWIFVERGCFPIAPTISYCPGEGDRLDLSRGCDDFGKVYSGACDPLKNLPCTLYLPGPGSVAQALDNTFS